MKNKGYLSAARALAAKVGE